MPVTMNAILQVLVYVVLLVLVTKPLGLYMTRVFAGERTWLSPVLVPVERLFYKLCGVRKEEEQRWTGYTISMLLFSIAGMLLLYLLERTQQWLPFNPQQMGRSLPAWHLIRPPVLRPIPTGRPIPASRP
ncbi:hypothetical protein KSB_86830 [Ktedonobacter robiniae]|uniref:Potassium-transporting ATPase subunit KdpA n=1 Tax=Ktedonobacter robiniae TaxID=2778365 RepID=A0ABQ3V5J6_9CHLR|nr:potassium-transporting ATPase subunit KdpA [Ktedonobacter robiniae]GHO60208.1 hypothetical protein KSB_86830 [Ktedonobacter robiniae]